MRVIALSDRSASRMAPTSMRPHGTRLPVAYDRTVAEHRRSLRARCNARVASHRVRRAEMARRTGIGSLLVGIGFAVAVLFRADSLLLVVPLVVMVPFVVPRDLLMSCRTLVALGAPTAIPTFNSGTTPSPLRLDPGLWSQPLRRGSRRLRHAAPRRSRSAFAFTEPRVLLDVPHPVDRAPRLRVALSLAGAGRSPCDWSLRNRGFVL